METVRRKKIKRIGRKITIDDLPEDFIAEEVDVIISPSKADEKKKMSDSELLEWRKSLAEEFSKFNVDLSDFKFNRDELYDRT